MLGFYNYTMLLTYISILSAGLGIVISLQGDGHPYIGTFFLMFCGLCDAFDGKVARTKKDRSEDECRFGIQIDSLSDVIAFGVLPACIGEAMIWKSAKIPNTPNIHSGDTAHFVMSILCFGVITLYILAATIRLAYFNVMEEKRQKEEEGVRKTYEGLPVTSAALIFPLVVLLQFLTPQDMTSLYLMVMVATGFLFLSKIKIRKPGLKGILVLIVIGVVEAAAMVVMKIVFGK